MQRLILLLFVVAWARCQSNISAGTQSGVGQNGPGVQNAGQGANAGGGASCVSATGAAGRCVEPGSCAGVAGQRARNDSCQLQSRTCCPLASITVVNNNQQQQPARPGCGWRNPNGVGARPAELSDGDANVAEFPWVVAIIRTIEPADAKEAGARPREVYVGGGSLIHPSVVLTAAHNVAVTAGLRVRAGEWDTRTDVEPHPPQDRDVVEVKVHEDFISGTLFYDAAVLFLASPMNLAPNVGLVCLPAAGDRPRPSTRCFAAGWGKDRFGDENRLHTILRKTELPVVDRNTCVRKLRSTRLGDLFELHSSFMCAGGAPGGDTCGGDSGAPLVCPIEYEDDRFQQNGIVAWGVGCGEDGTPGVYVDVAKVRGWIDDAVTKRMYEPEVYIA